MSRKRVYLGTNTKMYKTIAQTRAFLERLAALTADLPREELELFVIPSFTALETARSCVSPDQIRLGAQNMAWLDEGALTGEISPLMLKEVGVEIVELGHSERRHVLGESLEMIHQKALCAARHGFTVLLCVGETAEEKEQGCADEVLRMQLKSALHQLPAACAERLWVAYEPVWAIGEHGVPATAAYAEERHRALRETLCGLFGERAGEAVPLLYGGSVNPDNAVELSRMEHIDGLFIGRSAWDADRFNRIIRDVLAHRKDPACAEKK